VGGGLGGQLPDPTGQAPQGHGRGGGGGLNVPAGLDAQPAAGGHQLAGRTDPEPFPQDLGDGDHKAWSWRWASVAAWTAERRAASRTDSAARGPVAWGRAS
jgi:hypothetical protein